MNTRRRRNGRRCRRMAYSLHQEESNPMESLLNLSDIMLVLAVGIMLALVLHWNVPLIQTGDGNSAGGVSQSAGTDGNTSPNQTAGVSDNTVPDTVSLNRDDLLETSQIPEGSRKVGDVYYDEKTGNYYILQE